MHKKVTKINEGLYYDERSAGGLVFKIEGGKEYWLLIKTTSYKRANDTVKSKQKDKYYFKFPKGHLKDDEFLKQAALREVEEEAQVKARVVTKIGSNNYIIYDRVEKKKIVKKVTFFLMEYTGESTLRHLTPEVEKVIGREWMTDSEAMQKLAYDSERVLLQKAKGKLAAYRKRNGI